MRNGAGSGRKRERHGLPRSRYRFKLAGQKKCPHKGAMPEIRGVAVAGRANEGRGKARSKSVAKKDQS